MKPLVYIAGPYTKPDPVINTRVALGMWDTLWDSDLICPYVPHLSLLQHMLHPRDWSEWLEYDFRVIDHCQALFRIPGESKGADQEVAHATALGLPVFHTVGELLEWAAKWGGK